MREININKTLSVFINNLIGIDNSRCAFTSHITKEVCMLYTISDTTADKANLLKLNDQLRKLGINIVNKGDHVIVLKLEDMNKVLTLCRMQGNAVYQN
jgi:hypothetical protein